MSTSSNDSTSPGPSSSGGKLPKLVESKSSNNYGEWTIDVGAWLENMECLYNILISISPDAMDDEQFALTIVNSLPNESPEWHAFATGLRQRINMYSHSNPQILVTSQEFITASRDEHYFHIKNTPEVSAQVFTARSVSGTSSTKCTCPSDTHPSDTSTSNPSKHSRVQKTCTNSNCGRKGHENSECFAFGGGN